MKTIVNQLVISLNTDFTSKSKTLKYFTRRKIRMDLGSRLNSV